MSVPEYFWPGDFRIHWSEGAWPLPWGQSPEFVSEWALEAEAWCLLRSRGIVAPLRRSEVN